MAFFIETRERSVNLYPIEDMCGSQRLKISAFGTMVEIVPNTVAYLEGKFWVMDQPTIPEIDETVDIGCEPGFHLTGYHNKPGGLFAGANIQSPEDFERLRRSKGLTCDLNINVASKVPKNIPSEATNIEKVDSEGRLIYRIIIFDRND